jgi:hypothetical protein
LDVIALKPPDEQNDGLRKKIVEGGVSKTLKTKGIAISQMPDF